MGAIYLIRHGQASFGAADYDKLSKLGEEQSRVLGLALRQRVPTPDAVYCGSMRRHRETATACLAAMALAHERCESAGFNEYDHEEVVVRHKPEYADRSRMAADMAATANPRRAFQDMFAQAVARWVGGQHNDEYKESWTGFRIRCNQALDHVIAASGPSKTVLVFTSGGPVTAIVQQLLHIPDTQIFKLNWTLANCGITKIIYSDRGRYLSTLNDHSHFEGGHAKLITYR